MYKALVAIIGTVAVCITSYQMHKTECMLGLAFVCVMVYFTPADEEDIDSRRP